MMETRNFRIAAWSLPESLDLPLTIHSIHWPYCFSYFSQLHLLTHFGYHRRWQLLRRLAPRVLPQIGLDAMAKSESGLDSMWLHSVM
jgi:hypothetical protein